MKCQNCGFIHKTYAAENMERIKNILLSTYDFSHKKEVWMTATNIAKAIGIKNPTLTEVRAVGKAMRMIYNYNINFFRRNGNRRMVFMPHVTVTK